MIFPHLDERQRRLLMGAEARALGHGGIRLVAWAEGSARRRYPWGSVSWIPVLSRWAGPGGRATGASGGRYGSGLVPALLALVEPDERGDPVSPLRWTAKSTRTLADELPRQGHKVGADAVGDLLQEEGFSLQGNAQAPEGSQYPDRDAQFCYISK